MRSFEHLGEAVEAAAAASDVRSALRSVVEVLRARYELWQGAIVSLEPEKVTVLARWTIGDTLLPEGIEIALSASPDMETAVEVIREGKPVVLNLSLQDLGLLTDIIKKEGVSTIVAIPVHLDGTVVGIIAFGSSSAAGLTEEDIPFFTGLGRGIERRLAPMIVEAAARRD